MDVWGAFDRSTCYIRLIDFKKLDEKGKHRFGPASAAEVIPKDQEAMLPGCVIISDGLRAYRTQLEPLGYSHRSVCHKDGEFVSKSDPDLHTNSIDGSWGCFKNRIRAFGGIRKERLPLALYEFPAPTCPCLTACCLSWAPIPTFKLRTTTLQRLWPSFFCSVAYCSSFSGIGVGH